MSDLSLPAKYHIDDLVVMLGTQRGVGIIESEVGKKPPPVYMVRWPGKDPYPVAEPFLRRPYFEEWILFKHPAKGHWMVGRWTLVDAVMRVVLAWALIFSGLAILFDGEPWGWVVFGIGFSILLAICVGMWRNFNGKQF